MNLLTWSMLLIAALPIAAPATTPDEARLKPRWQALDVNSDGSVTLNELPPTQAAALKRTDLNNDGAVSLAEFVANEMDPSGSARRPLPDNVRLISDVPYAAANDPRQTLDIYLPKRASVKGPLPVIAFVHGGGWSGGSKLMARAQVLSHVNSGRYVAVSIAYRLSWQDTWPAQIHDAKAGIRWIRANASQYGFDPTRICAMGPSAGGHLAAQLATTNGDTTAEGKVGKNLRRSSKVQCVIDMMGPADLRTIPSPSPQLSLLGGTAEAKERYATEASPITHVDKTDPPFLIIHGTKDPVVNFQESVDLAKALRQAGVPVTFVPVEGGGHGDFGAALGKIDGLVRAFLEKTFYDPSVNVPAEPLHR